jgi:hypothetical protein
MNAPFAGGIVDIHPVMYDAGIYAFGGQDSNGLAMNTVYVFYTNSTWATRAHMPLPLRGVATAAQMASNSVSNIFCISHSLCDPHRRP